MNKRLATLAILGVASGILFGIFLIPLNAQAQLNSACDEYGVMAYESGGYCECQVGYVMGENSIGETECISETQACENQYGFHAKAGLSGGCECQSGYVFGTDSLGDRKCVDADSVCTDRLGYGARYDSLSNSCECSIGYVLGENSIGEAQCITEDEACENQLGVNSRATNGGQCKCDYGYVIDGGKCVYGDRVCRDDHGIHSTFDNLSSKCKCEEDYTFNEENQCVEKENSVYFSLVELDADNEEAIIESEHNGERFHIEYGTGCYDYAFEDHVDEKIVVNLGTDFSIDTWTDFIVLQDDDQTCDITDSDSVTSTFTLKEESENTTSYNQNTASVASWDNNQTAQQDIKQDEQENEETETTAKTQETRSSNSVDHIAQEKQKESEKEQKSAQSSSDKNEAEKEKQGTSSKDATDTEKNESFVGKIWSIILSWF